MTHILTQAYHVLLHIFSIFAAIFIYLLLTRRRSVAACHCSANTKKQEKNKKHYLIICHEVELPAVAIAYSRRLRIIFFSLAPASASASSSIRFMIRFFIVALHWHVLISICRRRSWLNAVTRRRKMNRNKISTSCAVQCRKKAHCATLDYRGIIVFINSFGLNYYRRVFITH